MPLYICHMEPVRKWRANLVVFVRVVEAPSQKQAIEKFRALLDDSIYYLKPRAQRFEVGAVYRF